MLTLEHRLIRSGRRTLALQVRPDATLVVRAPFSVGMGSIQDFIRKNLAWILRQQKLARERKETGRPQTEIDEKDCRRRALEVIGERAKLQAGRYGLSYRRLAITGAKRRWGSCSVKGSLNFSWRLVLAPIEVVDYVVAHELAHLKHPNHSPAFWAQVESWMPDYRARRRWLRQNQHRFDF